MRFDLPFLQCMVQLMGAVCQDRFTMGHMGDTVKPVDFILENLRSAMTGMTSFRGVLVAPRVVHGHLRYLVRIIESFLDARGVGEWDCDAANMPRFGSQGGMVFHGRNVSLQSGANTMIKRITR
jgi:hypothetical protein